MVKVIRKRWRRYYRKHKEALDFVGDFLGALSIFVFLYFFVYLSLAFSINGGK